MNFKKIRIEAFKSFGPETTEMDLDFVGVKLLVGKNGSGKTSFFDALLWCLFGKSTTKADSVVNKTLKSGCKVEVEFEANNHEYVITRYRNHKTHENNCYLFQDKENITLKGSLENQNRINDILGIDYRATCASVVLSSETYNRFLREKNSSRLSIFESIFSLKDVAKYSDSAKRKSKELEKKKTELQSQILLCKNSNTTIINSLKQYKDSFEDKKTKIKNEIASIESKILLINDELKKLEEINIEKEKKSILENKDKIQRKQFLEEQIKSIGDLSIKELEIKNLNETREVLENKLKKLQEINVEEEKKIVEKYIVLKEKVDKIKQLLEIKNAEFTSLCAERTTLISRCDYYKKKIDEAKKDLEIAENNCDECPLCKSKINQDKHLEITKQKEEIVDNLEKEFKVFDDSLFEKDAKVFELQDTIKKIKDAIPKLEKPIYTKEFLDSVSTDITKTTYALENANSSIKEKTEYYEKNKATLDELQKQLKEFVGLEKNGSFTLEELDSLSKKIEVKKIDSKVLESTKKQLEDRLLEEVDKKYVASVSSSVKKNKEEIESLEKDVSSINKELSYWDTLADVFSNGNSGFKKYFIDNTIDMFNEKINMYLPFFFDEDIKIVFDKDLNEKIEFRGEETEFNELSSGEKTRSELAVVFSLFTMVRIMFGTGTNIIVLDEILDENLDSNGVKAVLNILKNIANDSAVFVVSHRDEYKDSFDDVIKVSKDGNGFTKLYS